MVSKPGIGSDRNYTFTDEFVHTLILMYKRRNTTEDINEYSCDFCLFDIKNVMGITKGISQSHIVYIKYPFGHKFPVLYLLFV